MIFPSSLSSQAFLVNTFQNSFHEGAFDWLTYELFAGN